MIKRLRLPVATIRTRFLFAAVTPLVLITILMTSYLVQARQQDARQQFLEASRISTAYLGDSAVLELFSGDTNELQRIADSSRHVPGLVGLAWFSADRQPLAISRVFHPPVELLTTAHGIATTSIDDVLYLQQPIYTTALPVDDYVEDEIANTQGIFGQNRELVGWIIAGFDTSANRQRQQEIVLTGIGIALAGLAVAILLALYFGRGIVRPIRQLTHTVGQMESGNLKVRAGEEHIAELASLAQGINQLAESVAEGRRSLEERVHRATWRLEETLEDLKDKNRQLIAARENAEAADQAKSEFLARMSHELRTPITAIQGFIRLLQNTPLGDAERNYCTIINQSSSQLLNLIDDVLSISRLQSNAIEIDETPFNLIETLEQAVSQLSLPASDKGLELILDIAPEVPSTVVGDEFRVAQVITNLVSNAVKFTHEGHVRISVNSSLRDEQYTNLHICVSDTGIGIPEDKQDSLFQAFAQADTSITRQFGGTGLGLAIIKSLLDLMDGTITLESTEGVGTSFQITIPMPFTAIEKAPAPVDARVVLIDEHVLSRDAIADTLCRFVAELDVKGNIDDLLDIEADAVVLSLPSNASDRQNQQRISAVLQKTDAPLLALSAKPDIHRHIEGLQRANAAVRYLDKPAALVSLQQALQQLINGTATESLPAADAASRILSGLRILIAEDNPFTREFLKTLLSREGAFCITASNGVQAVDACNQQSFDIMLLDIHMPEKSGLETIRDIRSGDSSNCQTPIITITADVLQQERDELKEAGSNELLFKPVDEQQLLQRILHFCRPDASDELPEQIESAAEEIPMAKFLAEIDRLVEQITAACSQEELEAARDPVHQLLGIAGVFRLPELEVRVSTLHRAIKHHRHSQSLAALNELKEEVARLHEQQSA